MPPRALRKFRPSVVAPDDSDASDGDAPSAATDRAADAPPGRRRSRRRFLAGATASATVGLAGCADRLPGSAASVDSSTGRDGNTLIWNYPADAAGSDGRDGRIGYGAVRFLARDAAAPPESEAPALRFRLNSTVGGVDGGESAREYRADWFRFRIGVPRTYDGVSGLRASVRPPQWPAVRTTYGYEDGRRELLVEAPDVNEAGTIVVEGRFRPAGQTLPRRLRCQFEVRVSRAGPLGRTVLADGRTAFDVAALDLPDGVSVG